MVVTQATTTRSLHLLKAAAAHPCNIMAATTCPRLGPTTWDLETTVPRLTSTRSLLSRYLPQECIHQGVAAVVEEVLTLPIPLLAACQGDTLEASISPEGPFLLLLPPTSTTPVQLIF